MSSLELLKTDLNKFADQKKKREALAHFFQAYPGGYGEGDTFLGITVPDQRKIAKKHYKSVSLYEISNLLSQNVHEYRMTALFLLVHKYERSQSPDDRKDVVDCYLRNIARVNNWDLVDSSAYKILGPYLMKRDRELLYKFAYSGNLWLERIAIISTLYFIRHHRFDDTLHIAQILLYHPHDLIHKAVGWMLRETGKRNMMVEYDFLVRYYKTMPRTMLRYAIEKFDEPLRQRFLKGSV
ncbi:MAG: DNA alkylation repair protein [Bacteroidota bacterium]